MGSGASREHLEFGFRHVGLEVPTWRQPSDGAGARNGDGALAADGA